MIGLTLSGGGVKGSYQVGAYLAFKKCHINFSGITGTSIGAFNGAAIAAKMDKELLDFWLNLEVGKLLGFDEKYLNKLKTNDKDLEYYFLKIDNFIDVLKNKGVSINGLEEVLRDFSFEDRLRKSKTLFGLSTLKVSGYEHCDLFIGDIPRGSLNNYIIASCYLPIFKRKKLEDNSYFLDGGFYNYCPVNMLLEKGYKKVYAIDVKAVGISQVVKENDKKKVVYINPSRKLGPMLSLKREDIIENIQMGYYDTMKVLGKFDGNIFIFKKKKQRYYKKKFSKVSKKTKDLISAYFNTKDPKQLIIKALEYILKKDNQAYYNIYKIDDLLKEYQDLNSKSVVVRFINELN